ncbi:MAG: fructose-6-phosphate aldolase [Rickettsiales bacterium]|nr:fructose-6-phosphate aldolase [Rickettsiales bacterium]
MKFFVDTANLDEIKELAATGLLDGVTTNPSLVAKEGKEFLPLLKEICEIVDGPVSGEVAATDFEGMKREGEKILAIADNIALKLPLTMDGLKACKHFSSQGRMVNVTLCFSAAQALMAAKAGAAFISPFVGRLEDISHDGMQLIADIVQIYSNYDFNTEILVASIRSPLHLVDSALMGADVATIPPKVMHQLVKHPLTDQGLETFLADWAKTGQDI